MNKAKLLTGVLLVLAVLFAQVGTVFAAPATQDVPGITGTVTGVVPEPDANGVITTVAVTLLDSLGQTQTVRVSLDTAVTLGLVTVDPATQAVTVVDLATLPPVTIDPTVVIPDVEEDVHPIAALLASFFGMEGSEVDALHEDGFGFGVIAQAMWMAKNLEGDATTAGLILQAKKDNDFSSFTLPDGSTPSNWGQFKKAVLDKKNNLGVIVSGHAENETGTEETLSQPNNNNGQGKDKDKNSGKGKGKGNNKNP